MEGFSTGKSKTRCIAACKRDVSRYGNAGKASFKKPPAPMGRVAPTGAPQKKKRKGGFRGNANDAIGAAYAAAATAAGERAAKAVAKARAARLAAEAVARAAGGAVEPTQKQIDDAAAAASIRKRKRPEVSIFI